MKKMIMLMLCMFALGGVLAVSSEWIYHGYDKVSGGNLEVVEFEDELGIVENLIYNDMVRRSSNSFKAQITYAETEEEDFVDVDKFKFKGNILFDDKSKVKYSLEDFEVISTDIQEDNYAELEGTATLKYKTYLVVEKEIPVEVYADFYKDPEDSKYQDNNIEIIGDDVSILFEGGKINHKNKVFEAE